MKGEVLCFGQGKKLGVVSKIRCTMSRDGYLSASKRETDSGENSAGSSYLLPASLSLWTPSRRLKTLFLAPETVASQLDLLLRDRSHNPPRIASVSEKTTALLAGPDLISFKQLIQIRLTFLLTIKLPQPPQSRNCVLSLSRSFSFLAFSFFFFSRFLVLFRALSFFFSFFLLRRCDASACVSLHGDLLFSMCLGEKHLFLGLLGAFACNRQSDLPFLPV
ncbi:putative transmembrane protein [Toxoplasma gondii CAST]|uniref:Putative transmembrane protein n=1 Tax=Toxoplasma gondii CAST TaxID=943122 RepID=A0A425I7L6_TOXGO|nr:putative transmembrane protein [Toxoplasma gondii CAST]